MAPYVTCISPTPLDQQNLWSNSQHDDFLGTTRIGKLPEFQRLTNFSAQPKNTHYATSFNQVGLESLDGPSWMFQKIILEFQNEWAYLTTPVTPTNGHETKTAVSSIQTVTPTTRGRPTGHLTASQSLSASKYTQLFLECLFLRCRLLVLMKSVVWVIINSPNISLISVNQTKRKKVCTKKGNKS